MGSKRKLKKRIKELEGIVKSNSITLTDPSDENKKLVLSFENGVFSTDVLTITPEIFSSENLTTTKN